MILPDKNIYCGETWPVYSKINDVLKYRISHGNEASDNCTATNKLFNLSYESENKTGSCPTVIERVYRLYDECGNRSDETERIFVWDTIPPVVVMPDDLETDCYLPEPYANLAEFIDAGGSVSDDCTSNITMTYIGDSVVAQGLIYRTYRFFDECNYTDELQKITIKDIIPPDIEIPDTTLDCEPIQVVTLQEFVNAGGWFDDNCEIDSSSFKLIHTVAANGNCPKTFTYTYEIYDMSGNRDTVDYHVIVTDTIPPTLTCPPNDTIDASEPFPKPFEILSEFVAGGGYADDNCSLDSTSLQVVLDSLISDCESQMTYTYVVADDCGNWSEPCSYTIYKRDYSTPVISCPPDTIVACFDEIPDVFTNVNEFEAAGGSITDNYEIDEASFTQVGEDNVSGTICPVIIIRTYTVEDICGNADTCSYVITVNDTIPPVITCPPDSSMECLADLNTNVETIDEFIAAGGSIDDNCDYDPTTFTANQVITQTPGRSEIRTTFSIADYCGNIDSCTQVLISTDTIPPVPNCTDLTVYLNEYGVYDLTKDDTIRIAEGSYDNCTLPEDLKIEINNSEFTCEDADDGAELTIIVTDQAGLSDSCNAHVTVLDTLPPEAICQNITAYLDERWESFNFCRYDR